MQLIKLEIYEVQKNFPINSVTLDIHVKVISNMFQWGNFIKMLQLNQTLKLILGYHLIFKIFLINETNSGLPTYNFIFKIFLISD